MRSTEWQCYLTDRLRLEVRIDIENGDPKRFKFQLIGLVGHDWVDLVRYDNYHGSLPHRHRCYPDGTEDEHPFIAMLPATFIDQAQKDLTDHAEEYLEEYERQLSNLRRGV